MLHLYSPSTVINLQETNCYCWCWCCRAYSRTSSFNRATTSPASPVPLLLYLPPFLVPPWQVHDHTLVCFLRTINDNILSNYRYCAFVPCFLLEPVTHATQCTWSETGKLGFDFYRRSLNVCFSGIWQSVLEQQQNHNSG